MIIDVKGNAVLIDDEDYGLVSQYSWRMLPDGYVHTSPRVRGQNRKLEIRLHRLIMDAPRG